jgi:hypothetical protein
MMLYAFVDSLYFFFLDKRSLRFAWDNKKNQGQSKNQSFISDFAAIGSMIGITGRQCCSII